MPFTYETIPDKTTRRGVHYRVKDESDNRLATCFDEGNARLIVAALNYAMGNPVEWVCGHVAGAHCAECYRILAWRAHQLAEKAMELDADTQFQDHVD